MHIVHSAGAVLYRESRTQRQYILVQEYNGDIGFPKGHVERGETERDAALREIREEAGVHAKLVDAKQFQVEYTLHSGIKKRVVYFIACCTEKERQTGEVRRAFSLPYEEALTQLRHAEYRRILQETQRYLEARNL